MSAIEQIKELQRQIEDLLDLATAAEEEAKKHREQAKAIQEKVEFALAVSAEYEQKLKEAEDKQEEEKQAVKSLASTFRETIDSESREDFDSLMQCAGIEFEVDADDNTSENEGGEEASSEIVQALQSTA